MLQSLLQLKDGVGPSVLHGHHRNVSYIFWELGTKLFRILIIYLESYLFYVDLDFFCIDCTNLAYPRCWNLSRLDKPIYVHLVILFLVNRHNLIYILLCLDLGLISRLFECASCPKTFPTSRGLSTHLLRNKKHVARNIPTVTVASSLSTTTVASPVMTTSTTQLLIALPSTVPHQFDDDDFLLDDSFHCSPQSNSGLSDSPDTSQSSDHPSWSSLMLTIKVGSILW